MYIGSLVCYNLTNTHDFGVTMKDEIANKHRLGQKILNEAKATLFLRMRFFGLALGSISSEYAERTLFSDDQGLGTDCKRIFYSTEWLIKEYKQKNNLIQRTLIHILIHCIYKHALMIDYYIKDDLYHLTCDIITEHIIDQMEFSFLERNGLDKRLFWYQLLLDKDKQFIQKKLYHRLTSLDQEAIKVLKDQFTLDSHAFWPRPKDDQNNQEKDDEDNSNKKDESPSQEPNTTSNPSMTSHDFQDLFEKWDDIANKVKLDLELFSKSIGTETDGLEESLRISLQKKYDYKHSLEKFLSNREIYKEDLDTFDPIYYTYGLMHYDNLALIEYLEHKEQKVLDELVILIDTSGSTYGEEVKKFLEMSYDIITKYSTDQMRFKLIFIQIDMIIQEVVTIHSNKDFKAYIDNFVLKGMGGTDFKPGFNFVNQLIEKKELNRLKGVIYFTDGYGDFPKTKPHYDTLIVFYEDLGNVTVPSWAQKVVIREEDLL